MHCVTVTVATVQALSILGIRSLTCCCRARVLVALPSGAPLPPSWEPTAGPVGGPGARLHGDGAGHIRSVLHFLPSQLAHRGREEGGDALAETTGQADKGV